MTFMNTLRVMLLSGGPGKDASLVEREMLPTYYPATGFGEIPERIAEAVRAAGGRVRTGCRATEVSETSSGRMRVAYERGEIECTHVVSTIPLNRLCPILRPAPDPETLASAERLDYRGLIVLGMVTEKQDILGCGYIHVMNRPYNRICEMNEFSQTTSPEGENILCVELPCHADGPIWNAGPERLFDLCSESLAGDGFLLPGDVKRLILVKDPCAYPVYRKDYAGHLERVLDHIRQRRRLRTLGRCGEFMYMDTDKCLARAFAFADEMLAGFGKSAGER
jgi:protoporphyrinogen oxidase